MSTIVTVDKTRTITVTREEPAITPVVEQTTATVVAPPPPTVTEVERDPGEIDAVFAGRLGPRGPQGLKGDPGDINGSTDQLVEGALNLYFTASRAAAAAPVQTVNGEMGDVLLDASDVGADPVGASIAAASASMSTHLSHPDPHPQYLAASEAIDGGNF